MEIEPYIIVIWQNFLIHLYLYEFSKIQKIILFFPLFHKLICSLNSAILDLVF